MNRLHACFAIVMMAGVVSSCDAVKSSSAPKDDEANFDHWCKVEDDRFKSEFGGCRDLTTGIVWGMRFADPMTILEAEEGCKLFDDGGFHDWTLPARNDLVQLGQSQDALNYFGVPVYGVFFWAKRGSKLTMPQGVDLTTGELQPFESDFKAAVMCVRSVPVVDTSVKTCQSSEEIRDHIGTAERPKLVFRGTPVADINDRFCVHTVLDGSKRLYDGKPPLTCAACDKPTPASAVTKGLLVAIADVGYLDQWDNVKDGATFKEAQAACGALTLLGKKWKVPGSSDEHAQPRETDVFRSADAIGAYLYDEMFRPWWTSSTASDNGDVPMSWSKSRVSDIYADTNLFGVRCVARP